MAPLKGEIKRGVGEPPSAIIEEDLAAPTTDTPSPTPPSSISPVPSVAQQLLLDEAQSLSLSESDLSKYESYGPYADFVFRDTLPVDHGLPQMLQRVSGENDLGNVTELQLRANSREMSLARLYLYLPHLKILNLEGSKLNSLRDLGCGLISLKNLNVSNCGLTSLDGTFGITSIKELYAGYNQIVDIGPSSNLSHIRILDLRKNLVNDITYVSFLSICSKLENLILSECPVAESPDYRMDVKNLLPNLPFLDGISLARGSNKTVHKSLDDANDDDDDDDTEENDTFDEKGRDETMYGSQFPEQNSDNYNPESKGFFTNYSGCRSTSLKDKQTDSLRETNTQELTNSGHMNGNKQQSTDINLETPFRLEHTVKCSAASCVKKNLFKRSISESAHITTPRHEITSPQYFTRRLESPSDLTSGKIVCGNLTSALRGKKNKQNIQMKKSKLETLDISFQLKDDDIIGDGEHINPVSTPNQILNDLCTKELLSSCKKWRQCYTSFRDNNRKKWEKEDEQLMRN